MPKTKTVADRAYELVAWTAEETTSAIGLEALLALLEKFDGPAGLSGVGAAKKQDVCDRVGRLHAEAMAKEAQGHVSNRGLAEGAVPQS